MRTLFSIILLFCFVGLNAQLRPEQIGHPPDTSQVWFLGLDTTSTSNTYGRAMWRLVSGGSTSADTIDHDWYETTTSTPPDTITADIFTKGRVAIEHTKGTRNFIMSASDTDFGGTFITTGQYNYVIGSNSGLSLTSGNYNFFLGRNAGRTITTGSYNVAIGDNALNGGSVGQSNVAIGNGALYNSSTLMANNIAIGNAAGRGVLGAQGDNNIYIGNNAGALYAGDNRIFIGQSAGSYESGSNLLYIEASSSSSPLIYGDFDADSLVFHGRVHITDELYDSNVEPGAPGDVLRSTGTGTEWGEDNGVDTMYIVSDTLVVVQATDTLYLNYEGVLDNQTIDTFDVIDNALILSLEDDGEPYKVVDLGFLADRTWFSDDLSLQEDRVHQLNDNSIQISENNDGIGFRVYGDDNEFSVRPSGFTLQNISGNNINVIGNNVGTKYLQLMNYQSSTAFTEVELRDTAVLFNQYDGGYYFMRDLPLTPDVSNMYITGYDITTGKWYRITADSLQTIAGSDDQEIGLIGNILFIENGQNTVNLNPYLDNTDDQVVDTFQLTGTTLEISIEDDGEALQTVDLSSIQDGTGTDDQTISLSGNTLSIEDGNSVDLSVYLDNTDAQILSIDSSGSTYPKRYDITISNGNTISLWDNNSAGADGYISNVALNTNSLDFTGQGSAFDGSIDLSGYLDNTDDQIVDTFQLTGTTLELSIEDDGLPLQTVNLSSLQDGTGTDDQTLDLTGNTLSIEDGNSVDLSGYLDNTDNQIVDQFQLTGTNLYISLEDDGVPANVVNLSSLQDGTGTDDQVIDTFQISGNTIQLSIEDDGEPLQTIDLSNITLTESNISDLTHTVDTDDQFIDLLQLVGTELNISLDDDGVPTQVVDLAALQDGVGMESWNVRVNAEASTNITNGETVGFATNTPSTVTWSRTGNTIFADVTAPSAGIDVRENDSNVVPDADVLNFEQGLNVFQTPTGQANVELELTDFSIDAVAEGDEYLLAYDPSTGQIAERLSVTGLPYLTSEVDGSTLNEAWTIIADNNAPETIANQTVDFAGGTGITTNYNQFTNTLTISADGGGGDDDWTIGSGTIYNLNDFVGIGTSNPDDQMHIYGAGNGEAHIEGSSSYGGLQLRGNVANTGTTGQILFRNTDSQVSSGFEYDVAKIYTNKTTTGGDGEKLTEFKFQVTDPNSTGSLQDMLTLNNGISETSSRGYVEIENSTLQLNSISTTTFGTTATANSQSPYAIYVISSSSTPFNFYLYDAAAKLGSVLIVFNNSGNAITINPGGGTSDLINNASSYSLAAGGAAMFVAATSNDWAKL